MNTAASIQLYYQDNFDLLPLDKQFHFAYRLLAWNNDDWSKTILKNIKDDFLSSRLTDFLHSKLPQNQLSPLRHYYFDKYPRVFAIDLILHQIRHTRVVYNVDISEELWKVIEREDLKLLITEVMLDDMAVKYLSTFAITPAYVASRLLYSDTRLIDLTHILEIGETYDLSNSLEIRLLIYLFTHCIIYESDLYALQLPEEKLSLFITMLKKLDDVISKKYADISIDNKLEFLVCAKMCSFLSANTDRIYDECLRSTKGHEEVFLIDRFNTSSGHTATDFIGSEHRNILYIMAQSDYQLRSKLVVD
jgi:hypothetical protein